MGLDEHLLRQVFSVMMVARQIERQIVEGTLMRLYYLAEREFGTARGRRDVYGFSHQEHRVPGVACIDTLRYQPVYMRVKCLFEDRDARLYILSKVAYLSAMTRTSPSLNLRGRLLPGLLLLWASQFGLALWFMVGQGYDRATAEIVPVIGLGLLPLMALAFSFNEAFRYAVERVAGGKSSRMALMPAMMVLFLLLFGLCIIAPALVVLRLVQPPGPFDELWLMLGATTVMLGSAIHVMTAPKGKQAFHALFFLIGAAVGLILIRLFVFSFF